MDGWLIALWVGLAVILLLLGLLIVVLRAAARTAATAREVFTAVEDLQAQMADIARLSGADTGADRPLRAVTDLDHHTPGDGR